MSLREFIENLYNLSEYTIRKFNEYFKNGKIHIVKRVYIKHKILEFDYNTSGTSLRGTTKLIVKDELDIYSVDEFVRELSNENIFKSTAKIMTELYNIGEAQASHQIARFVHKIINEYYTRKLSNKDLAYWINTFINEIEGNPIDWQIEIWLAGVRIKAPIELEKGVILRPPRREDFEYELPMLLHRGIEAPIRLPDAILTINRRMKIRPAIYPYKEKLIILLQLYKLCSVYELRTKWAPKGVITMGMESTTYSAITRFQTTYSCVISESDSERITSFIKDLKEKISIDEEWGRLKVDNNIGVALSRYQDVLLKPEDVPNKIAYAVFGLEALYLKADERGELVQRLAQRVSKVMAKLGKGASKEIFKTVKRAYRIRSLFVHGAPLKSNKYVDKSLLDKLAEYLRTSILIFIQTRMKKDELINLIDDALIDESSNKKLEEVIKEIPYLE